MLEQLDFQWIMDNVNTGIVLLDGELHIHYLNPSAQSLLDTGKKALGQPLDHFFSDQEHAEMYQTFQRTLEFGHPFNKREAHVWMAQKQVVVDYAVTPVLLRDKATYLLLEIQEMDRVLRIAREESLRINHQVTRQLIRGVAHELKNPLGGIRGAAQLLSRALPEPSLRDYTQVIIEETDRLKQLADRMLGPRTVPSMKPINIHECLERVRHLIKAESQCPLELIRDYDPSLPEIQADPDQLIQVFLNISRNAMQALQENPERGRQDRIRFQTRSQRQYTIASVRHRLVLQIDIEDNGPGIPPELVDTLFYPMISGRPSGSGLGLAIAQDIISQYHGLIECHGQPGLTRFSIYIPITGVV